ncbi:glycosyltransferase family 2 protein [Paenibacillus frigoriresistens]|uniref:glycosyltransferase family 2 protein n=1 Tax=Paenibacillus alginolyticus TaxID=59839 RepID=UPI0015655279|nr:glycosyltransferase family 2 protein [Paenibacillus frigoriresistens]NRF95756.1 glycosyltransferase family 2 protein [Paenibacillus frigoriresistens]
MKILIIIPAFNEEKNIVNLLYTLNTLHTKVDILVVNDCSNDKTSSICKSLVLDNLNVIDLPCNLGIGGAVQTGYKYAYRHNYDIAIQLDGDGQHKPEYIINLIDPIVRNEADFVIGSRFIDKKGFQSSAMRRVGINYFSKLINLLVNQKITDPTSGFRACNKDIIELFASKYPVDYPEPESIIFLLRKKYKIVEIPVVMMERIAGVSSIHSFKSIYYMIKVSLAILIDFFRKQTI